MKLRFWASVLIFISAYSPLSVIFLIQDFELPGWRLKHPLVIGITLAVSVISCIAIWVAVSRLKTSSPPVKILKVSNRSGELVNYSIPYLVSFFALNLDDTKMLLSFGFFMVIMYWMTLKTHNIFVNPILGPVLAMIVYDVQYKRRSKEREDFFFSRRFQRLKANDQGGGVRLTPKSK